MTTWSLSRDTLTRRAIHIGELAELHRELSKKNFDIKLENEIINCIVEDMAKALDEYNTSILSKDAVSQQKEKVIKGYDKEVIRQEREKLLRACRNSL